MTVADAQTTAMRLLERLTAMFTEPTSNFSVLSLFSAFAIAAAFLTMRRGLSRPAGPRALVRALLPKRWLRSASVHADIGLLLFNNFVAAALIGWAFVSAGVVHQAVDLVLDPVFGASAAFIVPRPVLVAILTIVAFLAYEIAYFVDHYLKHQVPFLWHFHRVHHSAEELTPFTNARMHPVDSVIFANIVALFLGTTGAVVDHAFGAAGGPVAGYANFIVIGALYLIGHLQHSHVWIPFTGTLGKLILSPAHHQLHHSANPQHFNRNFGATLAVFDHLAGTLLVPTRAREQLTFGAGPFAYDPHSITGTLVMPFVDAAAELRPGPAASDGRAAITR